MEHLHIDNNGEIKKTSLVPTYLNRKSKPTDNEERIKELEIQQEKLKQEMKELRLLVENLRQVRNDKVVNCKLNNIKCGVATLIGDLIHLSLDIPHEGKVELFSTSFYKVEETEIKIETENGDIDVPLQLQNNHYYLIVPECKTWPLKLEITL